MLAAQDEAASRFSLIGAHAVGDGVIDGCDEVAEDAAQVAGPSGETLGNSGALLGIGRSDVGITPGSPEMIHEWLSVQNSIEGERQGSGVRDQGSVASCRSWLWIQLCNDSIKGLWHGGAKGRFWRLKITRILAGNFGCDGLVAVNLENEAEMMEIKVRAKN